MFVVELAWFDLVQIVKIRTVLPDNPMDPANLVTSGFEQHNDDEEVEVKNKRSNSHRLFMPCSLEMMGIGVGVGVGDGDGKGTGTGDGNNVLTCRYDHDMSSDCHFRLLTINIIPIIINFQSIIIVEVRAQHPIEGCSR